MGKDGSGSRRDGCCHAGRCTAGWWCSARSGPGGSVRAGIGDAGQASPLAVIRSSETAVSGGWKGPGQVSWLQLICPMVGVIPAPHDAWRKSDIPMVATGYQCCGSRDVTGITGDLDVRDASSRLPMVRRQTHARTVVSSIRPTRGSGSGPPGHGPSGRTGPTVSARASTTVARQTVRT